MHQGASHPATVLAGFFKEFSQCSQLQHLSAGSSTEFGETDDAWGRLAIRSDQRGGAALNVFKFEEVKDAGP